MYYDLQAWDPNVSWIHSFTDIFTAGNPEDRPDIDANFPGLNYSGSDEPEEVEPELPKVVGEDATVLNVPKRSTSMNSGSTTASSSARWEFAITF